MHDGYDDLLYYLAGNNALESIELRAQSVHTIYSLRQTVKRAQLAQEAAQKQKHG